MKKLLRKRRAKQEAAPPSRITNETVAEHRERILAGGRRYKYPIQYARHRLVIVTITLTAAALILIGLLGWWQLYVAQSSNTLLYRATQIMPIPVASVDGQSVRYSDYLMYFNSSMHYLRKSGELNDDKTQIEFQKRQNMDIAIRNAYAEKLAKELGITVTQEELDRVNQEHLTMANGPISQETYNASTLSLLGWTPEEEQRATRSQILKNNVAYKIDDEASSRVEKAAQLLQASKDDFSKVAEELGGEGNSKVAAGISGMVPLVNNDGGLTEAARNLDRGQISSVVKSTTGDGYYFVKLLEKTDTQLNYEYIRIPLTEFDKRLKALREAGKIHEYIKVETISDPKIEQ